MPSAIDRVILSFPTHLSDVVVDTTNDTGHNFPESWIQVAHTGDFVSSRYGEFSITRDDLAQMSHNFHNITPKAPTRLPIDFDHLGMEPQKPGDGVAAGWINDLALRSDGDELWALVEWTPQAAEMIRNKQYQFVSPSFVKDYTSKTGEKIGTTLLAAAITNHPFLEGMAALTLSYGLKDMATPATRSFHLASDADAPPDDALAAAAPAEGLTLEVGQKVTVKDAEVQKPEQMGVVFTIAQVVGEGADAFVSLEAPDGTLAEWFRADELAPAPATTEVPPEMIPQPGDLEPATMASTTTPPAAPAPVHARRSPSMNEFRLTDQNGTEITLSADVLQRVIAKAIPDQVLIKASELNEWREKVMSLNTQVETMAKAAADAEARARTIELETELKKLSSGAFITKVERDWAMKTFKDAVDLSGFNEWKATKTTPILKLQTEHGSGMDANIDPGDEARTQLMLSAQKIQKEKRISLRDALIEAGRRDASAAERYRDSFRPVA